MIDGPSLVAELTRCGVTHLVWIPDTELGTWEPALSAAADLRLLRVCREGEAFALAAGLHLGGAKPIVVIQCTGMFEAGDALRNVIHDMKLPIFFIVGVRSYYLHQQNATADTCPIYAEPILSAWQIPYEVLDQRNTAEDISRAYRQSQAEQKTRAVLIAE
jgi:sulfopyruvate decarboxylase TPP-binding subunit